MKKLLILLPLLAAVAGGAVLLSSAKKGPSLLLQEKNVDFGVQDVQGKIEKTVIIRNIGTEDLVIHSVETDCGCTAALLSAKTIPAGGEGKLQIRVDVPKQGEFTKHVTLHTNDPEAMTFTVPISGAIKRIFAVDPKVLDFQEVQAGTEVSGTVTLQRITDEKVGVTGAEASSGFVRVGDIYSPDGVLTFIKVSLARGAPAGEFEGAVLVKTSSRVRPEITIPVKAKVVSPP